MLEKEIGKLFRKQHALTHIVNDSNHEYSNMSLMFSQTMIASKHSTFDEITPGHYHMYKEIPSMILI